MKKTVKQWCLSFGFDWYGPGIQGNRKYDYKIVYRDKSGETTCVGFFASAHGASQSPKREKKRHGEFLLFPVYRQVIGQKEISRHKFEMVSSWVQNCLLDEVSDYTEYLRHLPTNENQTASPEVINRAQSR
jgi:hypothetical protein